MTKDDMDDTLTKVLVVDDSSLMHRLYDTMLADSMDVVHAHDGKQALALLVEHRDTKLVVLDINMPEMDGLTFLQEFLRDPLSGSVPVIIVTTEGSEEDTIRGLKAGASAYVRKPFQRSVLMQVIEKTLVPRS
jgi:two-component system, chemotaxis family, chemotaxis protein CheY